MNFATATTSDDRVELLVSDAAWQLAQRGRVHAGRIATGLVARLHGIIRASLVARETRRAQAATTRMSAHQLRDLGIRRGDVPLLAAGLVTRHEEV